MKILGIDTALGACSAALMADGRVLARAFQEMPRGHAEALAPVVQEIMREAGLVFAELDRIAVTTGPGTFTGQRVGLAFARALALGLGRPAIGVTTLDAMAEAALHQNGEAEWAIAAADAKRGEIYLGVRNVRTTIVTPELIAIADTPSRLQAVFHASGATVLLAGTATEMLMPLLTAAGLKPVDSKIRQPDGEFVARLASTLPEGPPPKPLYLRAPDAKLPSAAQ